VNKQAPIKNEMPTRKHEPNNNDLRYDGSRYNQNAPPAEDEDTDYQAELELLHPSAEISVELPFKGNGNMFQVRTVVSDETFIGRASTMEEALAKCCKKAVKFIRQYWDSAARKPLPPHQRKQMEADLPSAYNGKRAPASRSNNSNASRKSKASKQDKTYEGHYYDDYYEETESDRGHQNSHHQSGRVGYGYKAQELDQRNNNNNEGDSGFFYEDGDSVADSNATFGCGEFEDPFTGEIRLKPNVPIKNAVMMLNELFPPPKAPQYKVTSQTGPPNNPTFTMVCSIGNKSFRGEGKSKKEAKLSCSQAAIEMLYGYTTSETVSVPERSNPRANCDLDDWMELEGKNPVSILNELYPGIQYQLISTTGPSHAPVFIIKASLNDMSFEGSGKSKKDAKLNASKALLVHLHKVGFDPMTGDMMSTQVSTEEVAEGHSFADQIGQLVTSKYQALFGTTTYSKRRVMAGIVISRGDGDVSSSGEVICVSSGTKCINGEQLSLEGCVINDSHAEIVTRRCMVVYLYSQLELLTVDDEAEREKSIFQKSADDSELHELKPGIEFHLFITTSPCGDARIFSLHENPSPSAAAKDKKTADAAPNALNNVDSDSPLPPKLFDIEGIGAEQPNEEAKEEEERDGMMAGLTAAVADTSLKSNHDQQGQRFCGQENADDAAASETHPPPNAPLPEEPVLPSTAVDDPQGSIHDGVRKEPSFEADRDAADAGQQQPSIQELSPLPPCSSTPPPRQYDDAEAGLAQIGDGMPPVIGVTHSKLCQLLGAAADSISESAVQNLLLPKIYVTPPSDDCDDSPTPECFSETASTITERGDKEEGATAAKGEASRKSADSSRGMLRSKIECGMGTVPINPKILIQTWDGVRAGDRLLTMACSDKILRWNVLGIQGALLTHLIKPIYLKSITVGSKFHPGHMKRAVYERITPFIESLPPKYTVNTPDLYATTSPETRQATKAHDYSVNWIVDHGQPEIVNGSTGKTINDNTSRLSKKCLFTKFLTISNHLSKNKFSNEERYSEVKQMAVDYQTSKAQLIEALNQAGCGHWIEKPVEQDQFSISI